MEKAYLTRGGYLVLMNHTSTWMSDECEGFISLFRCNYSDDPTLTSATDVCGCL